MVRAFVSGMVLVLALPLGVHAGSIDGSLSDWGVTPGSDWHNNVGAMEWIEPAVGSNGYVGPGWGGQTFNVEAMYLRADATFLYYAIVTGFPETGAAYDGTKYYPGDIFFDVEPFYIPSASSTPTGIMNFAVETTSYGTGSHTHGGKDSRNEGRGAFFSNVSIVLAADKWDDVYYPIEIKRSGGDKLAEGTLIGQTDFVYTDSAYGGEHWVIEGRIPIAMLADFMTAGGQMSWTMTCANDLGNLTLEIPLGEIPEPGTVLLTGTGLLLGVGLYLRRRIK